MKSTPRNRTGILSLLFAGMGLALPAAASAARPVRISNRAAAAALAGLPMPQGRAGASPEIWGQSHECRQMVRGNFYARRAHP